MKYLLLSILFMSCADKKVELVDRQRELQKQITDREVRIKAIEVLQDGYSIKIQSKYDTIIRPLSSSEMDDRTNESKRIREQIRDSVAGWEPLKDSLQKELYGFQAEYDSIELELKKY